jgi:ABC-type multidrug transport system fused ATPase/permease subunit
VGWLRSRERIDAERLGQSYVHVLRLTLFERLSSLAPRALEQRSQGGVMLRFVGDLNAVKQWVSLGLSRLIVAGTFVVGALAALAIVNLALAAAVGAVRIAANVNEKVASIGVVQVFGQADREKRRIKRQSRRLRSAMVDRARVIGRMRGLAEAAGAMASAAVLLVGAIEVGAGRASPGTIVAAMALVGLLVAPLRDLGRVQEYWHNSRVSLEKMEGFLATPARMRDDPGAPDLDPGPGRLEMDAVELEGSLGGASAVAEPGSVVALVGPNGAGKSSLLAVVARLIDPDAGRVLLDGQDLSQRNLESVRRAVSMVGPDLPLLRGTVERNLRYRSPDAPEEELMRVWSLCGLDEVLADLPDGLETKVRDGGKNLSAGQRQRIALGRALLGDPQVLLLDEADANLDAGARDVVDRVIREQGRRSTVIVVSHRAEVLEWADVIWRMDGGRLVADPVPAA